MKTINNLFGQICSFDNLYKAAKAARKEKKATAQSESFHFHLEGELLKLRQELVSLRYCPGAYTTFTIYDPKTRLISAAPYRDRVVHHALHRVIEPLIDPSFIYDSYANRVGKGAHRAIDRYQKFARKYDFVLKCDIRKFFPSLDHEVLKASLRRKISCAKTLWLIDLIIDHSNPQEPVSHYFPGDDLFTPVERRVGLPIGNLTSQFWANVYMNSFDHFVKESLGVKGYIRYVDDFVLLSNNKSTLHDWKRKIQENLNQLRLTLHPRKSQVFRTSQGVPFLGFQVFPRFRYVQKAKVWRHHRYLRKQMAQFNSASAASLESGLNSWLGHIRFGQSQRAEARTFSYLQQQGLSLYQRPGGSWGLVEQQQ